MNYRSAGDAADKYGFDPSTVDRRAVGRAAAAAYAAAYESDRFEPATIDDGAAIDPAGKDELRSSAIDDRASSDAT